MRKVTIEEWDAGNQSESRSATVCSGSACTCRALTSPLRFQPHGRADCLSPLGHGRRRDARGLHGRQVWQPGGRQAAYKAPAKLTGEHNSDASITSGESFCIIMKRLWTRLVHSREVDLLARPFTSSAGWLLCLQSNQHIVARVNNHVWGSRCLSA